MLLRKKTQIIIGVTVLCLVVVLFSISRLIFLDRFAELEVRNTRQDVKRASSVIADEIANLDAMALDWAAWDDTYAFVEDANPEYIGSNLVSGTFSDLRLSFMLFATPAGQIVYAKSVNWPDGHETPIPASLYEHLDANPFLLHHLEPQSNKQGILVLPEGPVIVASRPILTSKGQGPIRGTLLMGRYLDAAVIERWAQITHLSLTVTRLDGAALPADVETARASLSPETPILVRPLSANAIVGYTLLTDLYGRPGLIVSVRLSREIYQQGQLSLFYFLILLATGLVFGSMAMLLLERMVLSRLTQLSENVGRIGAGGDLTARLSLRGEDELGRLADDINTMLEALERSQHELRESEAKFRRIVEQSVDGIMLADERGSIIEWNQGLEQITGLMRQEVLGQPLWDAVWRTMPEEKKKPAAYEQLQAVFQELVRTGRAPGTSEPQEREIQAPDGTRRIVQNLDFPIRTELGWMAGSITRDVTERKQTEMMLNQRLQEQETLFAIGQLVSSSLEIDVVMQQITEQMTRLVGASSCAISDWDPDAGTLTVVAEYIRPDQRDPNDPINDMGVAYEVTQYPITAAALRERTLFVVYRDDAQADSRERQLLEIYDWDGVAGIPLVVRDRVIGLAEVYLTEGDPRFTPHDLRLLQALANQVAVAVENARLFSAVRAKETALRNLSLRLLNVQEQERRFLAQELHDELGQLLTATKISIDLARRKIAQLWDRVDAGIVDALATRLEDASALTDKVLTNVRALTVELRPTLLDDMGIIPTLRWYLGQFAIRTGIQVEFDAVELSARLPSEVETTIYRVVQEALTNVARHAQAGHVQVRLRCAQDSVTVSVTDDGSGFDLDVWTAQSKGSQTLGLAGIQERAMLLDGRVSITSRPGSGTQITMTLPAGCQEGTSP